VCTRMWPGDFWSESTHLSVGSSLGRKGGGGELVRVFSFCLENMESEVSMGIAGDAVCRC
jgi:hypothetical protein